MAEKKPNASNERWKAENTVLLSVRLFKTTDADIVQAIEGKPRATEIKRLIRLGLQYEREQKEKEQG